MPILELSDRFLVVSAGRKLCVFDFPLQEEVNPVFCYNIPLPAVGGGDKQGEREDNDDPASAEILTVAFSRNGDLFALASSSKQCAIFDCGAHREWTLVHAFSLPKWPTAVVFDHSNDHLLVADRAGHVLRYSLRDKVEEKKTGESVLGHFSMVLAMVLSSDGRFLLTGDRDEKLRISRYPQGYVIEAFGLGHSSYICALDICEDIAFTSGGDSSLIAWRIETGSLISRCDMPQFESVRRLRCVFFKGKVLLALLTAKLDQVVIVEFSCNSSVFSDPLVVSHSSPIFDLALHRTSGSLLALSSEAVLSLDLDARTSFRVIVDARGILSTELTAARCTMRSSLAKNVAFNNMEEYRERKRERIEKRRRQ